MWAAIAGVLGLAFGSFWTVLTYRWPREESVVSPRSHCTNCDHVLSWYENIPVLSWLILGRRCSSCREPISWRYPALELATGLLAAGSILAFGANGKGVAVMVMTVALVPVVVIDIQHKLIPDVVVLPAAAIATVAMIVDDPARWWVPVTGALGAAAFLMLLRLVKPGGMGLGDVKLALLLGAVLGVVLMARQGTGARKNTIPFGPYLALGAIFALWVGPTLISLYTDRAL